MLSKNKTSLAFTVKLLLASSALHAQDVNGPLKQRISSADSIRHFIFSMKQAIAPVQLPGNFYAKQLPFFCSKELQVQKAIGFPVKFRVGTVEYCDKLEGKNR
ncbi:hypothetical protein [Parafilimonas sp.]|uniref:hypothetical protein n=1 Tax=Parafilimonas sp. TaxID=1969739 RepID=UPI0039E3B506